MALGQYADLSADQLRGKLDEIRPLGVSHVSIVVSWSTPDIRSAQLGPKLGTVTPDNVLARLIRQTREAGFKVFLFPILDVVKRRMGEWRGTIQPPSWDAWWRSYERFILHYARIAAREQAEMFCVGSELVSTERMRDRWVDLIGRVREVYHGTLVYSANWDHYTPVSFWDRVDLMGLTGYYQIAGDKKATEAQMLSYWLEIRGRLVAWSSAMKRPFFFTEIGYPSMDGGAEAPWNYTLSAPPDLEEQRRAYSAFARAWTGVRQLQGVFFWDWYGEGGPRCTRYTPRNKPAAEVIRRWFLGTPAPR
jgi:hypothetical protein